MPMAMEIIEFFLVIIKYVLIFKMITINYKIDLYLTLLKDCLHLINVFLATN